MRGLGKVGKTNRGFEYIEFKDHYSELCSLQASSLATFVKPGTSAVWLGTQDSLHSRMHLNRKQVEKLIAHLQNWLECDTFKLKGKGRK